VREQRDEFRRFGSDEVLVSLVENPKRQEVSRQTEEFLKAGGRIHHIDPGVTGESSVEFRMGFNLNLPNANPSYPVIKKKGA
jgi:hypothetical protein